MKVRDCGKKTQVTERLVPDTRKRYRAEGRQVCVICSRAKRFLHTSYIHIHESAPTKYIFNGDIRRFPNDRISASSSLAGREDKKYMSC